MKENQQLKGKLHALESRLINAEDEKNIVRTINTVVTDTSDTFKNKIYQDRQFYDTLCDSKDRDYKRLRRDYENLIIDHKDLCEKYSDLGLSKGRVESEAAVKHGDDLRVAIYNLDYKQTEWSAQGLQRRKCETQDRT